MNFYQLKTILSGKFFLPRDCLIMDNENMDREVWIAIVPHKQELPEDSVIEVLVCLEMSLQAPIVLSLNETMAVEMKESTRLVQV